MVRVSWVEDHKSFAILGMNMNDSKGSLIIWYVNTIIREGCCYCIKLSQTEVVNKRLTKLLYDEMRTIAYFWGLCLCEYFIEIVIYIRKTIYDLLFVANVMLLKYSMFLLGAKLSTPTATTTKINRKWLIAFIRYFAVYFCKQNINKLLNSMTEYNYSLNYYY